MNVPSFVELKGLYTCQFLLAVDWDNYTELSCSKDTATCEDQQHLRGEFFLGKFWLATVSGIGRPVISYSETVLIFLVAKNRGSWTFTVGFL